MTTQGKFNTEEGCSRSKSDVSALQRQDWNVRPLVPLDCVELRLVVHTTPGRDAISVSLEAKDPHSRELLAHYVDPSVRCWSDPRATVTSVALKVRQVLVDLFDPEPF